MNKQSVLSAVLGPNILPFSAWIKDVVAVSIQDFVPQNGAIRVYLHPEQANQHAVCVSMEMVQIDEFDEVGRLCLQWVEVGKNEFAFTKPLEKIGSIHILEFCDENFLIQSGLVFNKGQRDEVRIGASSFSWHISLLGFGNSFDSDLGFDETYYRFTEVDVDSF